MAESEKTQKNDFVEIEFLGRNLGNNEIFDTNIEEESKKLNPDAEVKPLIVCISREMVVKGFDEALEGKEVSKKYNVKISPEKGFGKRDSKLVRLIPLKMFLAQKIYPEAGMTLALDNSLVKVVSVNGGRVLVDFNNPLAGKDIEYEFTIKRKIKDTKEKANSLQKFLFGHEFEIGIDEEKKKIVFKDLKLMPVIKAFAPKFKEILGYDAEIFEKKEEKKEESKKADEKDEKIEKKP